MSVLTEHKNYALVCTVIGPCLYLNYAFNYSYSYYQLPWKAQKTTRIYIGLVVSVAT